MKTVDAISVDPDTDAILECLTSGRSIATEIRDRIRAEARRLSDELRKSHGVQQVSAQLIRECRDEA